ncbi:uncharacterized protein LOC111316261 [Durio zibethinus]|uniref:Uncharacterized protein LOC111316261 n=1 Tax=Durio zibethinus TaxID=66656 RepID=A0A6P6BA95_DURZI|nr:uncharacterized protein LOC111316261 [Durio zibethinus]
METPSSARRVTRSQTLAALNNSIPVSKGKNKESEKSVSKTRTRNGKQQQERSVLIDVTNDSPIVGLAMETPSSAIAKQRRAKNMMMTPGSGEALLRGQVKTLLLKVEEEAEQLKVCRPFLHIQGCVNSPMGLLAPTPANTPQVSNLSEDGAINNSGLGSIVMALPVVEDQLKISEAVSGILDGMKQEVSLESQKSLITRSLLLDFSDQKSESLDSSECNSVVIDEGVITGESNACKEKTSPDDDNASIWSVQLNASAHVEDEEIIEEMGNDYYEEEEDDDDYDGGLVDELCEGLSKICMKDMFTGKHTRFVYNSDDEIEECAENEDSDGVSLDIIRLKGLPTPKGKHLRFPMEEQDD